MTEVVINKGFVIRGYYIPPFRLTPGKLIRIYIPNFSNLNELLGYDLALELIDLLSKKKAAVGLTIFLPIPYAKNYSLSFWEKNIINQTTNEYLVRKFGATYDQASNILQKLGIRASEQLNRIGFNERKLLTVEGLFVQNEILSFDYYGMSPNGVDKINYVIEQALDKGKCAVGFDNLQYMEKVEPYEKFERVIVEINKNR